MNCTWIEHNTHCDKKCLPNKSYCEAHYRRAVTVYTPEMADYVIEKELKYTKNNHPTIVRGL